MIVFVEKASAIKKKRFRNALVARGRAVFSVSASPCAQPSLADSLGHTGSNKGGVMPRVSPYERKLPQV